MKKGFTLLELLIVIVVIGILAAVSVPRLMSFIDEGKRGAATAELDAIKGASRLYLMHTGKYPGHVAELVVNKTNGTGPAISGWKGPYMEDAVEEVTKDPWENEYKIYDKQLDADGNPVNGTFNINGKPLCGILIVSFGPNGVDDGKGATYSDDGDDIFKWLKFDGEPLATGGE
ncbi:MAG: type II secretion system GspH family protein [Candidatus Muirbacterium halophilum]|nr:type II secretion system GspH family protein [Candidatus Muirbacterium halophilum]MCK9476932.1 type II secretion system GspH family protein [Candidatus Muirbacterium halophilum]